MEENKRIFVDSSYFVAFFNINDSLHKNALVFEKVLREEKIDLVISNFVFSEIVTILSQKVGKAVAIRVGRYFFENPCVRIVYIDEELHNCSWQIFQKMRDKNISFVDCSDVAVMRAEAIYQILTFDREDFEKLQKIHRFQIYALKHSNHETMA